MVGSLVCARELDLTPHPWSNYYSFPRVQIYAVDPGFPTWLLQATLLSTLLYLQSTRPLISRNTIRLTTTRMHTRQKFADSRCT